MGKTFRRSVIGGNSVGGMKVVCFDRRHGFAVTRDGGSGAMMTDGESGLSFDDPRMRKIFKRRRSRKVRSEGSAEED